MSMQHDDPRLALMALADLLKDNAHRLPSHTNQRAQELLKALDSFVNQGMDIKQRVDAPAAPFAPMAPAAPSAPMAPAPSTPHASAAPKPTDIKGNVERPKNSSLAEQIAAAKLKHTVKTVQAVKTAQAEEPLKHDDKMRGSTSPSLAAQAAEQRSQLRSGSSQPSKALSQTEKEIEELKEKLKVAKTAMDSMKIKEKIAAAETKNKLEKTPTKPLPKPASKK